MAEKNSVTMDWLIFFVSSIVLIGMIIYVPQWFWVVLPFPLTYLAKALRAM